MWTKYKNTMIVSTILSALPIVAALLLWNRLPLEMAVHFNGSYEPDGWASRTTAALLMPLGITAMHVACLFVISKDPKRQGMNKKVLTVTMWICPFLSCLFATLTISHALGFVLNISTYVNVFLGVFFAVIGNLLPKCTPNYTVGIRVPWTLDNEDNWRYTHRIGGYTFTAAGIIVVITSFFGIIWVMAAALAVAVIIPIVASYLYYKKHS